MHAVVWTSVRTKALVNMQHLHLGMLLKHSNETLPRCGTTAPLTYGTHARDSAAPRHHRLLLSTANHGHYSPKTVKTRFFARDTKERVTRLVWAPCLT